VPTPGKLDKSLGEWWVENPWEIAARGNNLSCFERNRAYLNVGQGGERNFVEISHLTGADSDGDGRCAVAADFRNNGQLDLVVRQAGGGALLLYENRFPKKHYLEVSLRGDPKPGTVPTSNRQGIGARIVVEVNGRKIYRDMYPVNSYLSQAPLRAHFGLGEDTQVDRLTIHWPSGKVQVFHSLAADRHVFVNEGTEGAAALTTVVPGQLMRP
jgi:hypothetical protein